MADAVKRMNISRDNAFQDQCKYYMYQHAATVFTAQSPDADDLLLAKALWAGKVNAEDMARIVVTNATIGASVDAGNAVQGSDIEYVITTDNKFHSLALAYKAAGLIGV